MEERDGWNMEPHNREDTRGKRREIRKEACVGVFVLLSIFSARFPRTHSSAMNFINMSQTC